MIRNVTRPDSWALTRDVRAFVSRHPAPFWGEVVTVTGEWPVCSVSFVVPGLTRLILSKDGDRWSATVLGGTTEDGALRSLSQCDAVPRGPIELLSARVADGLQLRGIPADTLPPWLAGPVSHQLINRARALLTSAGISPSDAVMAAETLDEALCKRAPAEPTLSAILATLQGIGMSCRWIRNPGDTGINPEREALEDARAELLRLDGVATPEIMGDVLWNLRRVLGVT